MGETKRDDPQALYQEMSGCVMEGVVTCEQEGLEWEGSLRCDYIPGEASTVEVLMPERIAGVKAIFDDTDWALEYDGNTLNVGMLSVESISPALCLPRLMDALRNGWLQEQNQEDWMEIPCLRLSLEQSGSEKKILSNIWLRQADYTPLWGEIVVDGERILTAEFTSFAFYDTIDETS